MKQRFGSKRMMLWGVAGLTATSAIMILALVFSRQLKNCVALGGAGLVLACFLANATVLLPAYSSLAVLEFSLLYHPLLVGVLGGLGASLGELTGYLAGYSAGNLWQPNREGRLFIIFQKHPVLLVFLASVLPLPLFDVVGIMAGMAKVKPYTFCIACWLGKICKFTLLAGVASHFAGVLSLAEGASLEQIMRTVVELFGMV